MLDELDCNVLVLGSGSEADSCLSVADGIGARAVSLAGRTNLPELAGVLSQCRTVVANDSGGMHLAAAMGAPAPKAPPSAGTA